MSQKLILPINKCLLTASIDTTAYTQKFGFRHYGTDMVSSAGNTTVYASGDGVVKAVGYDNVCGNVVAVVYQDALNRATGKVQDVTLRYFHLATINVAEGQTVNKDDKIGTYGMTGTYAGTGPHLHLEADLDAVNILHTPTVKSSNYLKGTNQGAYGFDTAQNTVINALNVLHCKTDAPDNQTYTTQGTVYIRSEDKTIATVTANDLQVDDIAQGSVGIEGIDVSVHNGVVDWAKVKAAGKRFAFVRVGWVGWDGPIQGNGGLDKRFHENMRGAIAAGLDVGVYLYSYCKTVEAAKIAAREVLDLVKPYKLTYPIAFDIEDTSDSGVRYDKMPKVDNSAIVAAFLSEIEGAGYLGILYTYKSFAENYLDMNLLSAYDVWIAHYADACGYKGDYTIWQYKGDVTGFVGSCPGITGNCDLNVSYVDYAAIIREEDLNEAPEEEKLEERPKAITVAELKAMGYDTIIL